MQDAGLLLYKGIFGYGSFEGFHQRKVICSFAICKIKGGFDHSTGRIVGLPFAE